MNTDGSNEDSNKRQNKQEMDIMTMEYYPENPRIENTENNTSLE